MIANHCLQIVLGLCLSADKNYIVYATGFFFFFVIMFEDQLRVKVSERKKKKEIKRSRERRSFGRMDRWREEKREN